MTYAWTLSIEGNVKRIIQEVARVNRLSLKEDKEEALHLKKKKKKKKNTDRE